MEYPECAAYLVDIFVTVGPDSGGNAVSWQELDAFLERSIRYLSPGDCEGIILASRAFVNAVTTYNGSPHPPPFGDKAEIRQRVSSSILAGFRQMTGKA